MFNGQNSRAEWFYQAQWGVFMHFLGAPPSSLGGAELTAEEWNKQVDAFDVKGLARQLHEMRAPYLFITIGQNSGHYCSPNATYDRIVGHRPSKCSRRDLVADLYDALAPFGIKLLVYLPALGPAGDVTALEKLKCTPPWKSVLTKRGCALAYANFRVAAGVDERLTEFQHNWETIIHEWSMRWGKKVCGWWIDGCYYQEQLYDFPDEPNFRSFAAAMRSGNPESIVAWCAGQEYPPYTLNEEEDYTAGEINHPEKVDQLGRWVKQAQFHVLTYIGETWGRLPVHFSPEETVDYSRAIIDCGGVITWDAPHTPEGLIVADAYRPLMALGKAINSRGHADVKRPQLPQTLFQLKSSYITPEGNLMPGLARITLQNHWSTPISGAVHLQSSGAPDDMIRIVPPAEYRIAPGEKRRVEKEIVLTRPEPMKARLRVMVSQSDGRRAAHYPLPVRRAVRLPPAPAGVHPDDLSQALADAPARSVCVSSQSDAALVDKKIADIRMGLAGNCIGLLVQVEDSLMQRTSIYWDGSCLEVFATADDSSTIGQLFLLPATRDQDDAVLRVRSGGSDPVSQVAFRTCRNEKGYTGYALIPIPWLIGSDIMPDHFLFEIAVSAGVGKTFRRGVLFGEFGASGKTEGYGMICCV